MKLVWKPVSQKVLVSKLCRILAKREQWKVLQRKHGHRQSSRKRFVLLLNLKRQKTQRYIHVKFNKLERGVCTENNLPYLTLINRCLTRDLDMSRKIVQQQPVEIQTAAYDRRTDEFIARLLQYTPKQMHFLDEASVIQTSGNRRYGSSPRGQAALVWQWYASRCTYTVNLCCGYFGIDHFNILEGPSNALHMLNFFDEALQEVNDIGNPVLVSGDCVILDNCGFHHHRLYENMLRNMLQRKNITLLFQPPYSPEYNVCEYIFRLMRDGLRENNSLTFNFTEYAIVNSITNIKDCDVKSLYAHCGYV